MIAVILDVETTGVHEPDVIELAHSSPMTSALTAISTECFRFKPSKPIDLGAMATHHIIPADLSDCSPWPGKFELPLNTQYVIGHSVDFDWKAIGSPANVKRICTLALARYVWPKLDSHSLGALIYHIYPHPMARELLKNAHSAAADVGLCHRVLDQLWDAVGRPDTWEKLWEISEKARVPTVMPVGKHKGIPISQVPKDYKQWFLKQPDVDPYLAKALRGE